MERIARRLNPRHNPGGGLNFPYVAGRGPSVTLVAPSPEAEVLHNHSVPPYTPSFSFPFHSHTVHEKHETRRMDNLAFYFKCT